jgi:hypothetical protein
MELPRLRVLTTLFVIATTITLGNFLRGAYLCISEKNPYCNTELQSQADRRWENTRALLYSRQIASSQKNPDIYTIDEEEFWDMILSLSDGESVVSSIQQPRGTKQ